MTDQRLTRVWRSIPPAIWVLGFVSLLMDVSSEMIYALLPVYLVSVLGASALIVGVIEGVAEATASITKVFSGALSDRLGERKWVAASGYGLAALTKPIFALAPTVGWVFVARFIDRIGKGIRDAPRDALVADLAPAALRGASFGLRQALDTVGAFLGPLLAIVLMALSSDNFALVFWVAVVPGFLAFALIAFGVREPQPQEAVRAVKAPLSVAAMRRLGAEFWLVTAVGGVFTLARFSEAFLILKTQSIGTPVALIPAVYIVMNVAYAVAAYPSGALSDRIDRVSVLFIGLAFLFAADLTLAFAGGIAAVGAGVILWGLHMAFTQGLLATLVADAAPVDLRGTAFGVFNLISGVAALAASVIAGSLWVGFGPAGTFLAGALFTVVTFAGLLAVRPRLTAARAGPDRSH